MTDLDTARRVLGAHSPTEAHAPDARRAAVAVLLVPGERGLDVLFIERAAREGDPWSGQIAFPGGRWEPTDADLAATAIRETREETSIDLDLAERLGTLDDLHPRSPLLPPIVVRPFVFGLPRRPPHVASVEVKEAFWVGLHELRAPQVYGSVTVHPHGLAMVVSAYVLGARTIWGMTERILTPLVDLLTVEIR